MGLSRRGREEKERRENIEQLCFGELRFEPSRVEEEKESKENRCLRTLAITSGARST